MTFMGMVLGKKWEPDVSGLQSNGKTGNGIDQPTVSPSFGLASPLSAFLMDGAWGMYSLTPALGPQPHAIQPRARTTHTGAPWYLCRGTALLTM